MKGIADLAHFQAIFANSAVGLAFTDSAGRFVAVNRAYCRITGYTRRELAVMDWFSLTHPDDAVECRSLRERMLAGALRSAVSESRCIRKGGGIAWVRDSVTRVSSAGGRIFAATVTEDISDRKRAEEAVKTAGEQLRRLSASLIRAEEHERRRIARELHDSTSQLLAGLSMSLARACDPGVEDPEKQRLLADAAGLADQCAREIRTLSYLMYPPCLEEPGLASALLTYAEGFSRRTGIELKIKIQPDFGRLDRDLELSIYRIVQEGLANIHRHSGSPRAAITLERDARQVRLALLDSGHGFPPAGQGKGRPTPGVGIPGMRERAELLGGKLEITSDGLGTRVTVILPVAERNEEPANHGGG